MSTSSVAHTRAHHHTVGEPAHLHALRAAPEGEPSSSPGPSSAALSSSAGSTSAESSPPSGPRPVEASPVASAGERAAPSDPLGELLPTDAGLELDYFDHQPTPTSGLPDPEPLVNNLARSVVEILAGAREIEQIARWVTDDVYRHLLKRVVLAARARSAKGSSAPRPTFAVGSVRLTEPRDGVIEAVIVIHGRARARAVAVRLEGLDHRWRATAIHVL